MKHILISLFLCSCCFSATWAQKIGYIDSDAIMKKIPEYNEAQGQIDRVSQQWQQELEKKYAGIERLYKEYTAHEVLWPDDVKQQKQEAIFKAEREAKEYRESKFGYNGALFTLQESKIKPLQAKVEKAVAAAAKRKQIAMVFDKAGEVVWLYTDARYDLTEAVLKELGIEESAEKKNE